VYGFGSFFRDDVFNDVDLLFVLTPQTHALLPAFYRIRNALDGVSSELNIKIDLTVLTSSEFMERPLREMDSLVTLFP
jgi:hypothetical protein